MERSIIEPFSLPVGSFQGYDTVTGTGLTMALLGEKENTGGNSRVSYRVCSGIQELSEAMEIDQSLTVSFLSVASVSEKLKFVNSLKITTHSICIVVSAKHTTGKETATNWRLNPDIKPPTDSLALKEFFRLYGDSFMSARTRGGEYYAVYTFYAETQEKQSELTAELHAEGLFSVVSVDASLQVKLSKMSSTQTTRVSLDQSITGIANPNFPKADDIIQFALDFPSLELTSPVLVDLETTGYERVPGIGSSFDVIAANCKLIVDLKDKLCLLQQLQNDIRAISDIYSFYGGYDTDTRLERVKREADEDVTAVENMISAYKADPTQTLRIPELRSLANGTPSLRYEIQRTRGHGGGGGVPFDDIIEKRAYLQQKTRISALQFRLKTYDDYKQVITYVKVTYTNTNGSWVIERGRGNPGELTDELLLWPGQFVISINGNYTVDFLRSLGFNLSDGRKVVYGNLPWGFGWDVPKGSFLLGFRGRFSSYLDEVAFVYASFRPASWTS